jgi:glutaconyl-CoA/methylmalonyl-CoA decarboxylase subunit gamma
VLVTLTIDGTPRSVVVDLGTGTLTVDGVAHAVKVLEGTGERAELEIDGENVTVEGWPEGLLQPLRDLAVNGERVTARVDQRAGAAGAPVPPIAGPVPSVRDPPRPAESEPPGVGTVLRPPMPGKIIEIRVHEGEAVTAGQVLLVLEAMKMRNDVLAPITGTVRDVRVVAGANVRAKDLMLRIEPTGGP